MLLLLVLCILLVLIYVARLAFDLVRRQAALETFLESELKEIKAAQQLPRPAPLAYGWYDDGWPFFDDEEDRTPLENPAPHRSPDDYATQMYVSEFKSMPNAQQRKEFLRRLLKRGAWIKPELLDIIYADESAHLRAWAAGHLNVGEDLHEIRDYEPALLQDPEPIVRAALWSNPNCKRLPWSFLREIKEGWKEQLQSMSQLERLGLMRNPKLSRNCVVALLATPSEELGMSRVEHSEVLRAAAVNPDLIWGSRRTGRDAWKAGGDYNPPFEEYGKMWELCLEKWITDSPVPYFFMKYIQTTPEVKLATYKRLLENPDSKWLRHAVIESCDPVVDTPVLKLAWGDPDDKCREAAIERVGRFTQYVGVKERKSG